MDKPNAFDVMSYMMKTDNKALRLAPISNVTTINYNHKRGTEITIGFPGNITEDFEKNCLVGGFILINRDDFEKAKAECVLRDAEGTV